MIVTVMMGAMLGLGLQDQGSLIDRNRLDRPRTPQSSAQPKRRGKAKVSVAGAPVAIQGIVFKGAQAPGPVAEAARKFLGRKATRETLEQLAAALSSAYEKTDVAIYTVAIPDQDFTTGTLNVLLTEGTIAKIDLKAPDGSHPLTRKRLARLTEEHPLSRATMEREFTLIRAQPGMTLDSDFADPDGTGQLTLNATPRQKTFRVTGGYTNRGLALIGDGELDVTGDLMSFLRDGDQLEIAASATPDFRRYRYVSGAYSVPLSTAGLTLIANAAYLDTRPRGTPVSGTAKLAGLSLQYPLIRSFHRSADIGLGVDGIDNDNAAFGNLLAFEHSRAARLAGSFTEMRDKRSVQLSGSVSKGLNILNARVIAPNAEIGFLKVNGTAYAAQSIGRRAAVRVTATGQYSGDRLPAAERFSVGGAVIGRAFDTGFLTSDRGAGVVGEFAYRPIRGKLFDTSEVYVFADRAWVGVLGRGVPGRADYALASAGGGVRARFKDKAELGLELAKSVDDPVPGLDDPWRLSVSYKLSL